ncbi:MAG: pimeloyl-ACP methyl ester carboxylesterase [Myxococcota bacterium]|jgi:pimeloyl-ACP methyl ester carboxylesterase
MWRTALTTGLLAVSGCFPRYGDLPALAPEQLQTPLPLQHIEVDGLDLAYIDSGGDGPPVVLLHGLSSTLGFWEHQVPHLARDHRLLALDLPGFGSSDRPDAPYTPPWYADVVAQWMEAVGVPSAVIVGHSMGGQIAITLALEHPDRVDALALAAPAGIESFQPGAARWMKTYWTEDRALHSSEAEIRANFTTAAFNRTDDGVERLIRERVQLGKHPAFRGTSVAVSRCIAGMLDHPTTERLPELDLPTLIVFGTDDRMIPNSIFTGGTPRSIGEQARAAIPGARLVLLQGAGHTVQHDDPAGFNAALDPFLAEVRR